MTPLGKITVPAKTLQEAVASVVPPAFRRTWKKKSWSVNLVLDRERGVFCIVESRHERAAYELPLSGTWPERVQLDGGAFRRVVETYPADEILELIAYEDRLVIKSGRSPFSMPRIDAPGRKAIKTVPIPPDPRHFGPVTADDDAPKGRVELDATWAFSARTPVPHHRYPDSRLPHDEKNAAPPLSETDASGARLTPAEIEALRQDAREATGRMRELQQALTPRFGEAFQYAYDLHRGQIRKGTAIPYISHLMMVSALVIEHGGDEDQAIAALLHDAAEDQGGAGTLAEIKVRFGADVAAIVSDCTDSWVEPKPPWRPRKEAYLALLPKKPARSLLVSLADKTHNAEAILFDYRALGDELWPRFNGGAAGTCWYYGGLAAIFSQKMPGRLSDRLKRAVAGFGGASGDYE